MAEYRSKSAKGSRGWHWSDRSWWNLRRWLAVPVVVGAVGAALTWVGVWALMLTRGLSPWGLLTLVGVAICTAALAWAQHDINHYRRKGAPPK